MKNEKKFVIVVAKNDAEGITIAQTAAARHGVSVLITHQSWGAKWSEIEKPLRRSVRQAVKCGKKVYGVELQGEAPKGAVNIDHHTYSNDDRYNKRSSLEQICSILKVAMTPFMRVIAANDVGYIPAMLEMKATADEVAKVRELDRKGQGITRKHEIEAERAIASAEKEGHLTVIRMAHSKCATVTDRLFGQYENLLVLSADGETNFFGTGELCEALHNRFGGWKGGQLPVAGFWGGYAPQKEIEAFVKERL